MSDNDNKDDDMDIDISSDFTDDDEPLYIPPKKTTPTPTKRKRTNTNSTPKKKATPKKQISPKKKKSTTKKSNVKKETVKTEFDIETDSDYDDDLPLIKLYKKLESKNALTRKRGRSPSLKSKEPVRKKRKTAAERQEEEMPEYKWWLEDPKDFNPSIRWKTLSHNGVAFPPPYKPLPSKVKLYYNGKPIDLPIEAEEIACFYAAQCNSTGIKHTENPVFNKNFFEDFLEVLNKGKKAKERSIIKDIKKCDFSKISTYLAEQSEIRKNRSKEEKDKEKEEKAKLRERYGFAMVDGRKEKVGNFMVEPPGLFLGRGVHPKIGRVKKRIQPEDVTINISADSKIPECPIEGHKWKEIVHDDTVTWLAFWRENINDGTKYVWLAPTSAIKGRADRQKFEVARNLKGHIETIRKNYTAALTDDDEQTRQMATAIYLIDKLALRAGNEKGEGEADTVGCCSLRVEHITLDPPRTLNFDFLGKDSMRYQNSVDVPKKVFDNIKRFQGRKKPGKELFHLLTTTRLNNYLKKLMPGLTAKVFRTYNASITLQKELSKIDLDKYKTTDERVLFYNRANRQVAILCNHQRTLPKTHDSQMEKIDITIQDIKDEIKELTTHYDMIKEGLEPPPPKKVEDSPRKRIPKDPAKLKKKIQTVKDRLHKWEIKKIEKDENKSFSTTTSKMNYLDPRITVAWCKACDVDIGKIFSKTIRQKFPWAMDSPADFKW